MWSMFVIVGPAVQEGILMVVDKGLLTMQQAGAGVVVHKGELLLVDS